jgi:hypothetical protein
MKLGITKIWLLIASLGIVAGPATASAFDHPGTGSARLLAPRLEKASAVVDSRGAAERQREIFRILCGGAMNLDLGVSDHLWRVAESLAVADWQPPKVTIRVVVTQLPAAG